MAEHSAAPAAEPVGPAGRGPAPTASKSQRTYEWLRERIAAQEFVPGYRLVLGAIAEELGVSVVPVREAVRRLEAEGLVEFEKNVGARVAMIDEADYLNSMETLGVLEGTATALSLPHLGAEELAEAQRINDRMRELLDDFDPVRFTTLNHEFHDLLHLHCPNPHLGELVQREWTRLSRLRRSTFAFVPDRAPASVAEHDEILRLIRTDADPLDVELAVRRHRWRTIEAYRRHRGG